MKNFLKLVLFVSLLFVSPALANQSISSYNVYAPIFSGDSSLYVSSHGQLFLMPLYPGHSSFNNFLSLPPSAFNGHIVCQTVQVYEFSSNLNSHNKTGLLYYCEGPGDNYGILLNQ